jgi:succinate dehydrogenase subunit D
MEAKPSHVRLEPLLWILFSAGGVVAAFLIPVHLFLQGLAFPLGWAKAADYSSLAELVAHPFVRIYLFVLCSVPLFHFAHRIRYTLYDGLQIKHLNEVIALCCYGSAVVGTLVAGFLLWNIH